MSALAVDATLLEKAGVPVAAIGGEALVRTVGKLMARAHGYPNFPFLTVPVYFSIRLADEEIEQHVERLLPEIERVLSSVP